MNRKKKEKNEKIICFSRDADFYIRLGDKYADKGDLPNAYSAYREALAQNPEDIDACLAAAEVLYQMHCYEESNRILMIHETMFEPVPEIFFGLACNFYAINEFDYAEESLETYLRMDPDGPYSYDAEDFLDLIDDDDALAENLGINDSEDFDTLTICKRAEHLISCACPDLAVLLLEEHLKDRPSAYRAMDTLTTAFFELNEFEKAVEMNEKVRRDYPDSINAILNYAMILYRKGEYEACENQLKDVENKSSDSLETLVSVAAIYTLLKKFEKAYFVLKNAITLFPFDVKALFLIGYTCLMLKKDQEACGYYETLTKIDPLDLVARGYYRKALSEEITDDARRFIQPFALPVSETLELISELHDLFVKGADEIREDWQKDSDIEALFHWGLSIPNDQLRESIVVMLGLLGGRKAEYTLRDILLHTDQKDELKRKVFGVLKHMKAKEPYSAYLGSQWMQGTVTMVDLPKSVPPTYKTALSILQEKLPKIEDVQQLSFVCMQLFINYVNARQGKLKGLNQQRRNAFAAMLEYEASVCIGLSCSLNEIASRYDTSTKDMERFKGQFIIERTEN